ncbi:uncharacterized protein isoform X2 [Takifugu rubripes]|uniref:uncharacterized protein isoform X2 n=1 Tax=Takifugu rubripes TaxID=31033 RepID=UPI001145A2A3|nr:Purkinje cell protein 2 homolog isoform X2 [Takifugu rubripes]
MASELEAKGSDSVVISVIESTPDRNRKILSLPTNQLHVPHPNQSRSIQTETADKQGRFMDIIRNAQRGSTDEKRCSLDPCRSAPCTPQQARKSATDGNHSDSEMFFSLIANTQSHQLNDQRVSLASLPGIQNENATSTAGGDSSYLCYMVSKVQGARMDDQRCSLPQIHPTENHLSPKRDEGPPRSASFSTKADMEPTKNKEKASPKKVLTPADQNYLFTLMHQSQRGRMDEQRCSLNVTPMSSPINKPNQSTLFKDSEDLLQVLVNSQSRRLDDQRVTLPSLPGIGNRSTSASTVQERDVPPVEEEFFKMISNAQSGRLEDQRCFLPRSRSTPATPTHNGMALNNNTGADADAFFKRISSAQARRLDDQRVALPALPGISGGSERKANGVTMGPPPRITIDKSTSTASRKDIGSTCQAQRYYEECESSKALPKSISFTSETEYQKQLQSPAQITLRLSMSFTTPQDKKTIEQPYAHPEVFLTLGAPGDKLVIPLSPAPGRPLSLNLNLVPKDNVKSKHCSSNRVSPKKANSRSSSPNPATHKALKETSRMHEEKGSAAYSTSPKENSFSLIDKARGGQKLKVEQRKGKAGGKKEKKDNQKQ